MRIDKRFVDPANKLLMASIFSAMVMALVISARAQSSSRAAKDFKRVSISPDGNHVAWVETSLDADGEPTLGSAIYVEDLKSSERQPRRVSAKAQASCDEDGVAWSPDSKSIAFFSDAERAGQLQLYSADISGNAVRKLTSLSGFLTEAHWSPDGRNLAFLFTENAPRAAGPLMPMTPETGVIGNQVYEQRLTVVDAASGSVRRLSPEDLYVYEYDWSPDGESFAAIAAQGSGDANWYVTQLYTTNLTGKGWKSVYKPLLQIAVPRWSPDGKQIAFIEGLMSDEGSLGGDIFLVSPSGGKARNVTPGIAASPTGLHWQSPDQIVFTETIDGQPGVASVDLAGKVTQRWTGAEVISADDGGGAQVSLARDHLTSAVIRQSPTAAPEIWAGPIGKWTPITHANQLARPTWGEMKSLHWTSDGMRVQGWLLYPKDYDPSKHYPLVVTVHGGPGWSVKPAWPGPFFDTYELSAHGYFVLYPNPRGSFGQGETFSQANFKDFGYGDFRDILTGVDEVVKTLPVDTHRVGITGWSYGGYMTMWAVTQTNRFRAAVAGAGIFNWQSYYGENDIDEWMIPFFGASVYDDPAVYARSAPVTFIKNAKTPTLVLVGERDGECPAPQSREFWHALKTLGVETQLVIYPGEGHAFLEPEHRRDVMNRLIGWFDQHMPVAEK
jgi:dipeptidyl aminopeptidase/acylaminoacyl peptidase